MKSHWRRTLAITLLLAAALLVCASGSAWASKVVGVEIWSPTKSSPIKWARPDSTVTVTTRVTFVHANEVAGDDNDIIWVSAIVDTRGTFLTEHVTVSAGQTASRVFSVPVYVPDTTTEGRKDVIVKGCTQSHQDWQTATESEAVYVDATLPVVTLGALPTTPTTNPRPTWTWSGTDPEVEPDCSSGLDYYIVKLADEPSFQTTSTSFTPSSNLADGSHVLRVKAVDKAGNVGTEKSFSAVTIDTTPPEVPEMPTPEEDPTNDNTPKWTWPAIANVAEDFDHYNVYEDGAFKTTAIAAEYTSGTLTDGLHSLEVTSVDNLGNESARSTAGHVLIDTTAPIAPVMNPMPAYSKPGDITFSWSVSDDLLEVRYDFQYSLDGGITWKPAVVGLTVQSYTVNATAVADGQSVVGQAMAYDAVGNESAYSASVSTTIDGTGPTVSAVSPLTAYRTSNPRPTWEWSWDDHELSGLDYFIVIFDGELPLQTTGTSFTPSSNLADGPHVLRVKAVDKAGNVGTEKSFSAVTIDTTPPEAPEMPTSEEDPTNDNTPKWTWPAIANAAEDFDHYNVYEDGKKVAEVIDPEYTSGELADGLHTLEVTSVDDLGNESARSMQGRVVIDTEKPAVLVMNPMPQYSKPGLITFSWSVSDDALEARYDFQYSLDGGITWEPTVVGLTAQCHTVNASQVADGQSVVGQAMAYDAVGNESAYSASVSTITDGTGPIVTLGKLPETPTENRRPTWTWSGVDVLSGLDYYVVTLDGEPPIQTRGTSYTPVSDLPDGEHILSVYGVDNLDNAGEEKSFDIVLIDTTPLEAPGMPRAESPTADRRPTWTWNATSGAVAYRVFLDGVAQPASEPNGTGQPGTTFTPATDLADGWHYLQVTAIDALGNESARSAAGIVLVDGTSPAVPDIAHLPTYTQATQVVFRWSSIGDVVGYDFSYIVGDGEEWTALEGITTQSFVVMDLDEGIRVKGRVRAYDSLRNTSGWSDTVSTTIDLTGPVVSITSLAAQKNTNLSTFTWKWTGSDGERGSGVRGYWVKFNDEAWSWTTEPVFTSSRLYCAANVLRVKGVDNLGNEGAVSVAPAVTLVDVAIFGLIPAPGEHPINEASTIVFSVAGLYDGQVEVLLNNKPIEDTWRLVTIVNTPALAKFYVLLDDAVMQPGPLTVTIEIGDVTRFCDYEVLDERTGFGFGRLRPW